jgi:DNA polymerase (family X)
MDNYQIADNFSLLSKLMDIHGENSFKSKTYSVAAFTIEKLPMQLADTPREKIAGIKGIGDSTAKKIMELLDTGQLKALQDIIANTPTGIIEMLGIKGIGPKKIATIWKEMEIESIGELLYACKENRLKLYKGFGEKTQQNVMESIEFYLKSQGSHLYANVEVAIPIIEKHLTDIFGASAVQITGAFRRQSEIINELEFVVHDTLPRITAAIAAAGGMELKESGDNEALFHLDSGLTVRLYACNNELRNERVFYTTGTPAFNEAFRNAYPSANFEGWEEDTALFASLGLPYIAPCLREDAQIIGKAQTGPLPTPIQPQDIKGIIHSHSNWSDGSNTIEEMARAAMGAGLEYLVISDHSKSAFYAQGLSEERIKEQHRYIDELNGQLAPFKIFKSIECDILNDGNLDYSNPILGTFDLVIASVHSNLKMTEEKAMLRLLTAIENPYTTILGHMTGRLLLSRKGYPVDHQKIIDACAANKVAIELNAHPSRLDMDWRWIEAALEKGILISIDPDAHTVEGFADTRYGVLVAQKAMLTKEQNLSSFGLAAFEAYLQERRSVKGIGD